MPTSENSLPPSGPALQRAFEALIEVFQQHGVRYAIIGGLAMLQHARVRTTDDIDALLIVPQIAMPGFFEALAARGFRIELKKNITEFRDQGLTTLQFENVMVDLMRLVVPAFAQVLDRAVDAGILGKQVRVSSAEGLIVMKLISYRPLDQSDIVDLLAACSGKLDLEYIRAQLDLVMEAEDPRRVKFESWVANAESAK